MLEDLGNIGDLLGGIGVIVTLAYLAIQIRQNTRQLQADAEAAQISSLEGTTEDIGQWLGGIIENRDVAELWGRGLSGVEELDATDRLRFEYLGTRLLQTWQSVYRRTTHAQDSDLWVVTLRFARMYLQSPGFRELWERSRSLYLPEFVAAIDRLER